MTAPYINMPDAAMDAVFSTERRVTTDRRKPPIDALDMAEKRAIFKKEQLDRIKQPDEEKGSMEKYYADRATWLSEGRP